MDLLDTKTIAEVVSLVTACPEHRDGSGLGALCKRLHLCTTLGESFGFRLLPKRILLPIRDDRLRPARRRCCAHRVVCPNVQSGLPLQLQDGGQKVGITKPSDFLHFCLSNPPSPDTEHHLTSPDLTNLPSRQTQSSSIMQHSASNNQPHMTFIRTQSCRVESLKSLHFQTTGDGLGR